MPPRFAYWTIIIDDAPTAFRARDREELIPTYRQLLARNPNATIKWFARGKLWESPDQARAAIEPPRERRGPDWRPGGRHEDPRARFDKRSGKRDPAKERSREGKPPRKPAFGKPAFGKPAFGKPAFRKPAFGKRAAARVGSDKAAAGRRTFGKPAAGKAVGSRKTYNPSRPQGGFKRPFGGHHDKPKGAFVPPDAVAKRRTSDKPRETEPPVPPPPRPPGPDRPPKPGHEPAPTTPEPETIRILPEPPERAK